MKNRLQEKIQVDIKDLHPGKANPRIMHRGILVIDPGILPSHPLLKDSVGDAIAIATKGSNQDWVRMIPTMISDMVLK